ncbi:MAG: lytic murein transglycosylase [Deferrisomatales bacterium]
MRRTLRGSNCNGAWVGLLVGGLLLAAATSSGAQEPADFGRWLAGLKQEAVAQGISRATVESALDGVAPISRVVELDRSQPELTWTLETYLDRVVSEERVRRGREKLRENRALLQRVSTRYGVPPTVLVALWGIETDYGRLTGGFPVVPALATLAYDGRRSAYFRKELLDALRILDAGHIPVDRMTGSWAGAMGQPQFMPSSFLRYAVDFDGDARADIWTSRADVLASAANYLAGSGWVRGQRWGREVRVPAELVRSEQGAEATRRLSAWRRLGVRRADGRDLPRAPDLEASLVEPDGPGGRAFLTYRNYRVLLTWNRSHLFALAVGTLADRIGAP